MTADLHQQAKGIFAELVELGSEQRELRLVKVAQQLPELAREVRSLLDYHTAQSLIAPSSPPKLRTRSTLSTTYHLRRLRKFAGSLRGVAIALPIWTIALLLSAGLDTHIRDHIKTSTIHSLNEAIEYRLREFRLWEQQELARAVSFSQHTDVAEPILQVVESVRALSPEDPQLLKELRESKCWTKLEQKLAELAGRPVKFAVWDRRMLTLVDWNQRDHPSLIGQPATTAGAQMLAPILKGQPKMFLPRLRSAISEGFRPDSGGPVLSILVPVFNPKSGAIVAAIMFRDYGLDEHFASMVDRWSRESQGETYLLNSRGALLSTSRYSDRLSGLSLAFAPGQAGRLVLARDPGVDLLAGAKPAESAKTWPPTLLATQVTSGENGAHAQGYRNYVGQKVVGAWRWLADHDLGLALEESYYDKFIIARYVRGGLLIISSLFALSIFGLVAAAHVDSKRNLRDISEVGPYQIQEVLGEGGMGRVYLAEHSLLCRQSAIKVLTKGGNDLSVISRFEREVQLASQLTHPNTIAIYDFGRSREGVFYYAMEYIPGGHLGQLVEYAGPLEPGRAIYILRQLCRALAEAHQAGVVHRDVKPQNIMVCNRGGEPDFVKLFDYGLVKAFAPGVTQNPSQTKVVVGTPRFMAPERLNSPWLADPRVDVYSVGALAYYLLTAQLPPLVMAGDETELEQPGVETLDLPPDIVDFGGILSVCMAVEPASRPSNMRSLIRELESLAKKFPWERQHSEVWWSKHEDQLLRLVKSRRLRIAPKSDRLVHR